MSTTATMIFIYDGKEYPYEYNFDRLYPDYAAHYMFEDGNYSCDCNRSMFINSMYGTNINPLMECGETIQMRDFQVHNPSLEEIGESEEVTQITISFLRSQNKDNEQLDTYKD